MLNWEYNEMKSKGNLTIISNKAIGVKNFDVQAMIPKKMMKKLLNRMNEMNIKRKKSSTDYNKYWKPKNSEDKIDRNRKWKIYFWLRCRHF